MSKVKTLERRIASLKRIAGFVGIMAALLLTIMTAPAIAQDAVEQGRFEEAD
jgi:predicted cobalt transporter CbtA